MCAGYYNQTTSWKVKANFGWVITDTQHLEGSHAANGTPEGAKYVNVEEMNISGGENSPSKGPEAGMSLPR